ncbi:MAG: hypothetical protein V4563_18260 [Pseudomonadota bacterium]
MAVWEVRAVLSNGSREWSNVYHIDIGADTDVDPTILSELATFYNAVMLSPFALDRIIRRPAGVAGAFIIASYGVFGGRALAGNLALPLFNTVKMLLDSGAGRPGFKFLRGMLLNVDLDDSQSSIDPAVISDINIAFDDVLNAASAASQLFVEGSSFAPIVSTSFEALVAMRQLHRKRRATP